MGCGGRTGGVTRSGARTGASGGRGLITVAWVLCDCPAAQGCVRGWRGRAYGGVLQRGGPRAGSALAVRGGRAGVPCLRPRGPGPAAACSPPSRPPRAPTICSRLGDAGRAWLVYLRPRQVLAGEEGGDVLGAEAMKVQKK